MIFDRSWYNRAGVERVMGYTKEKDVERFLEGVPKFERWLVESGASGCCRRTLSRKRRMRRFQS